MSKLTTGDTFVGSQNGIRQITAVMSSGSVTLEALAGGKTGTPVAVTDGALSASGIITFYAMTDQWYKVTITGDAEAWLVG